MEFLTFLEWRSIVKGQIMIFVVKRSQNQSLRTISTIDKNMSFERVVLIDNVTVPDGNFDLSISMATTLMQMTQMGQSRRSAVALELPKATALMQCDSNLRRSG